MSAGRVIVTGGGKGIGAEIVRRLAASGYDVDFTCRASASEADALLGEVRSAYPAQAFQVHHVDLMDRQAVEDFAKTIMGFDGLYGFVHNAGATYDSLAAMINQDRAAALMQVNFWSMTRLIGAALRPMIRARKGRIVAMGSVTSQLGTQGNASYAASKGAIASYIRTLAIEIAARGITANVVAPGFVETDMIAPYITKREALEEQIPMGRFATSSEIAGLVRYLVSEEAGYITGSEIAIDGGLMAVTPVKVT